MLKWVIITYFLLAGCVADQTTDLMLVKRVIDGDTFVVDNGTKKGMKVRLIGVNAPESRNYKHKKEEPFGKEASAFMEQLLLNERVKLEFDVESADKYGRSLAYAFLENGVFVNDSLLRAGWADLMTIVPNVKHIDEFVASRAFAIKNNKGMWAK